VTSIRKEQVEEGVKQAFTQAVHRDRVGGSWGKKLAYLLATHWAFTTCISACIVANTVILALDRYPISNSDQEQLENLNLTLTMVFVLEMLVKLTGLGFRGYFKDSFNTFDCVIVIVSIVDTVLTFTSFKIEATGAISAMRAFRLLRIFKLAKSWRSFRYLLKTIGQTLKDISTFGILLFLFIFTFTILGMETFGYKAKFNSLDELDLESGSSPEYNFDTFLQASSSVFIVLANDGWSAIFFAYHRAVGAT